MKADLTLAAVSAVLWLVLAGLRVGNAEPVTTPAEIVVTTDGSTHQVDVEGGGVGYPGPNSVEVVTDEHGVVVVTRVRLFHVFDHTARLPVVLR